MFVEVTRDRVKHARVTLQTQLTLAVFKSRRNRPASAPDVSVHPGQIFGLHRKQRFYICETRRFEIRTSLNLTASGLQK